SYVYSEITYNASASLSGSSVDECRNIADKALKISETCAYLNCTFAGIWNGGGGDGVGFVNASDHITKAYPSDFEVAAKLACQTKFEDAASVFPSVDESDLPYICLDLVYQYSLLVDGFGLDPAQEITLVKKIKYQDGWVEAAWPLGSAIEAVSSSSSSAEL
ncbi:Nucleoside phosphatase, partial [Parasponia andersonii]